MAGWFVKLKGFSQVTPSSGRFEAAVEAAWLYEYTDGSATDAVTSGGAGVYVRFPEGEVQSANIPAGKYCSNYMAAIQALVQAASMVRDSSNECHQVVFLSNALSVLEATAGDKLAESLHEVAQHRRVGLQWVPAYCGLSENENVDELATLGVKRRQQDKSHLPRKEDAHQSSPGATH